MPEWSKDQMFVWQLVQMPFVQAEHPLSGSEGHR